MRYLMGIVLVAVAAATGGVVAARAQLVQDTARVEALDDTEAQRLFGTLMSPYCPGLTIATCPSPGADSLRRDIRARLARGETPRVIVDAYVAAWGEQVLGAPPARNWALVLWVLPGLLLVAGAVALSLWLRSLRRVAVPTDGRAPGGTGPLAEDAPPAEPALVARLEAELREFGKEV